VFLTILISWITNFNAQKYATLFSLLIPYTTLCFLLHAGRHIKKWLQNCNDFCGTLWYLIEKQIMLISNQWFDLFFRCFSFRTSKTATLAWVWCCLARFAGPLLSGGFIDRFACCLLAVWFSALSDESIRILATCVFILFVFLFWFLFASFSLVGLKIAC